MNGKRFRLHAGLLAVVWVLSAASALASFSGIEETPYEAGTLYFYGNTYINSAGTYNNSGSLVYSNSTLPGDTGPMYQVCNSGTAGDDYYYAVGEMVQNGGGIVSVNNNSGGAMQGYVTGSGQAFAAGFWGENNTFNINNSGVMDGEVSNNDGSAVGLYVNAAAENLTNNAGGTCSATAAYSAFGVLAEGSGVANLVNHGTITATASGGLQGDDVGNAYAVAVGMGTCCGGNYPNYFENDGTVKAIVTASDATNNNCRAFNCWAGCGPAILRNTGLLYTLDASGGDFEIYEGSDGYDDYLYNSGTITNASNGEAVILENDSNAGDIHFDNLGTVAAPNCAYCIVIWGFGAGFNNTHIWFTNSGTFIGGQVNAWWASTVWDSGDVRAGSFNFGGGSDVHLTGLPVITPTINGGGTSSDTLSFNLIGALQKVNGQAASGTNFSAFNLGSSGSIEVSGQTYSWGGFSSVSGTVSMGNVPSPWVSQDLGSVGQAGGAVYANGQLVVRASGSNIWNTADAFHYVCQAAGSSNAILARVSAEQGTNGGTAKAGVMIRDSLNPGAANAFVGVTPGNGVVWQYRSNDGGGCSSNNLTSLSASYWVKLTQSVNTFTGYYSVDGVNWTQLGSTTITMGTTNYTGLAYCNNNPSTFGTVTFDNVSCTGGLESPSTPTGLTATAGVEQVALNWQAVGNAASYNLGRSTVSGGPYTTVGSASGTNYTDTGLAGDTTYYYVVAAVTLGSQSGSSAQVSATPAANVPLPWLAQDIGAVGLAGNESCSNGVFTVLGSGDDIWNAVDTFHFVYEPVTNNCTISARVTSVQAIDPWSKAGVMIRGSLSSNSVNAFIAVTPSNGVTFQYRSSAGGDSANPARSGLSAPYWVKLVRSGSTFTGYCSPDGANWTQQGTTTITMPATVYVGLAVTAHNNSYLCAATFDNVSAPGWLPTPPTGLVATAVSTNQINLVWDTFTNRAAYNVERATTSGGPYIVIATGLAAPNYNDTGLALGTTYFYVVNAVVSGSETPNSAEASAATPSPFVYSWGNPVSFADLSAGQILTNFPGTEIVGAMYAQNSGSSITVTPGVGSSIVFAPANSSWAGLTGGNGYTTGANTNSTGNANFNSCLNAFYYDGGPHLITLSNLVVGQQYSVQLFALDDRSLSPAGSARTVNWQNPADSVNVSPSYSMADNTYLVMTFTASNAVQAIQENLLNAGYGNFNCLVLRAVVAPSEPAGLTVTAVSTGQINLTWNAVAGAASYNVQRSLTNGGPYAVVANGVTATNYYDTGLAGARCITMWSTR